MIRRAALRLAVFSTAMVFFPFRSRALTPMHRDFMVYFDRNDAGITQDGRAVIDAIRNQFDLNLRLQLVGHRDTNETSPDDKDLSQRRAEAVLNALVASGIPADRINIRWAGAQEPVVLSSQAEYLNQVVSVGEDIAP